jgi:hypothetical protein
MVAAVKRRPGAAGECIEKLFRPDTGHQEDRDYASVGARLIAEAAIRIIEG